MQRYNEIQIPIYLVFNKQIYLKHNSNLYYAFNYNAKSFKFKVYKV